MRFYINPNTDGTACTTLDYDVSSSGSSSETTSTSAKVVCSCPDEFTGEFCQTPVDVCASSPCSNGGTCVENLSEMAESGSNEYSCTCPPGFTGTECENDINECDDTPCFNGGSCMNTEGPSCVPAHQATPALSVRPTIMTVIPTLVTTGLPAWMAILPTPVCALPGMAGKTVPPTSTSATPTHALTRARV